MADAANAQGDRVHRPARRVGQFASTGRSADRRDPAGEFWNSEKTYNDSSIPAQPPTDWSRATTERLPRARGISDRAAGHPRLRLPLAACGPRRLLSLVRIVHDESPILPESDRMPIYEYVCKACNHQFEALVRGTKVPVCEACGGSELEQLMSLPAIQSESTKSLAMRAAKRRDQAQGTERIQEQIRYEKSHDA